MTPRMTDTDVLVVGAGPTGLTAASELARLGVAVRLVDATHDRRSQSRAIGVQPRTLELLASRGLADDLIGRAGAIGKVVRHARGFPPATIRLDAGVADTRFRQIVFVSQTETERVLEDEFVRLGGQVERGVELRDLTQDASGVTSHLRHPGGAAEELRSSHVIGADGAGSTVRSLLGLGFEGRTYQQSFVVADVVATGSLDRGALNIFLERRGRGQVGFMPLGTGGTWRMLAMETHPLATDEPAPTPAELDALARAMTRDAVQVTTADWISRFRIHLRSVEKFRVGRVFLAGDAAHTHSLAGGQGMNTGIGDAWNLAWKLGYVVRGWATDPLLDSYQTERHPVAEQILRTSDRAFQGFVSPSPLVGWIRGWLAPMVTTLVGALPGASGRAARTFSQLEIGYPDSPVVAGDSRLDPRPGARLPDVELPDGTRVHSLLTAPAGHHLLLCSRTDPTVVARTIDPYQQFLSVVDLPDATFGGGAVLVRPDGHVEFRTGPGLDGLAAQLAGLYRPLGPSAVDVSRTGQ